MRAEDIIEGLNKHIEDRRKINNIQAKGHLVLQRVITPNPAFKAYKTYEAILWFVKEGMRYIVIKAAHTAKTTDGQEEMMEREANIKLSFLLFNWIGSDSYNEVLIGIYKGEEK